MGVVKHLGNEPSAASVKRRSKSRTKKPQQPVEPPLPKKPKLPKAVKLAERAAQDAALCKKLKETAFPQVSSSEAGRLNTQNLPSGESFTIRPAEIPFVRGVLPTELFDHPHFGACGPEYVAARRLPSWL